jgi:PhoH-like ATPase
MASKYFILDTNVLLHNPASLYAFSDNTVVIPLTVIEELDTFKTSSDKKGKHARQVLREIDSISRKGALEGAGAKLKNGGRLKIGIHPPSPNLPLDVTIKDNKILSIAFELQQKGELVFFISKDINARIKALALGIKANDYEKQKVEYSSLYRGWRELDVSEEDFANFFQNSRLEVDALGMFSDNEYISLQCNKSPDAEARGLGRYVAAEKAILPLKPFYEAMGIKPVNREQIFAFDLLLNDDIPLVTLIGPAGTGKTLAALACGLQKVIGKNPVYEKLLVARPIMPLGKDIGYLPGTKDQKLNYWMQPVFDNLNFILQKDGKENREAKDKDHHDDHHKPSSSKSKDKIEYLLDTGLIEVEAITYIRGRSIPNQIIIIDEAQNLTPHEVKTIISRVGEGTKIILTGDPEQIDNPYLDANSNGLSYTAERFKNHAITGHIFLSKSERSMLASLAAELL